MFVGAFHNGLKEGHINESLAQRPTSSLAKVVISEEFYIKGEKSNTEKKARDLKECVLNAEDTQHPWKRNYTSPIRVKTSFK